MTAARALAEPIPTHGVQAAIAASRAPFPAYVGGYGSGKTHALVPRLLAIVEDEFGIRARAHLVAGRPQVDIHGIGHVIFRSMDASEAIIGQEVVDSLFDELDTLRTDKAAAVWRLAPGARPQPRQATRVRRRHPAQRLHTKSSAPR